MQVPSTWMYVYIAVLVVLAEFLREQVFNRFAWPPLLALIAAMLAAYGITYRSNVGGGSTWNVAAANDSRFWNGRKCWSCTVLSVTRRATKERILDCGSRTSRGRSCFEEATAVSEHVMVRKAFANTQVFGAAAARSELAMKCGGRAVRARDREVPVSVIPHALGDAATRRSAPKEREVEAALLKLTPVDVCVCVEMRGKPLADPRNLVGRGLTRER